MPSCDMCGKETDLFEIVIEGSVMKTCGSCSSFGKILRAPPKKKKFGGKFNKSYSKKPKPAKEEVVERVILNFSERIRKIREKKGLTQKEFAKLITEKESLVQKMESKGFRPSIGMAKKIERILKTKLTELEPEKKMVVDGKKASSAFTLGDFIKIK